MGNYSFNDLIVGMVSKRSYHFTELRVEAFSALIEDAAPVHVDVEFAKRQGFKARIVHGLFVQSVISGMLGNDIPGTQSVINNLSVKMHLPVLIGQRVDYQVEITALTTAVSAVSLNFFGVIDGETVISGKALCSFPNTSPKFR
ncbi:MAG: MaoC family dehydratase N-terminal domain-containing protein [Sulfuricella sp.]|nr:MaoC family dehydratase N-terminal domain-containing protein [Sulfuricella sp.]